MASTVGTTTAINSIRIPPQRNAFHAAGRFWVFYCKPDTNDLVYQTSTDGVTWGDIVEIGPLPTPAGANYDLTFDGTYVHYIRNTGLYSGVRYAGIKYRRGVPESDGTISWSAAEQTALADGNVADDCSICIDSNGYPWVAYGASSGTGNPTVSSSSTSDGTWVTKSGYPLLLYTGIFYLAFLLPQTNGKLVAIIYKTAGTDDRIQARFYNGVDTWSAIEYVTPDSNAGKVLGSFAFLCGVAINDEIHLVYRYNYGAADGIEYVHGTSGSWSDLTELANSGFNTTTTPVISYDGNNLYVFWLRSNNHVYYRKYSGSWETAVDWIDESTDTFTSTRCVQCFYESYDGNIGLCYQTKASSPYNVQFGFLEIATELAAKSSSNTRAVLTLATGILLAFESSTGTRAALLIQVTQVAELELRSATASRMGIALNSAIGLSLRSITSTRGALAISVLDYITGEWSSSYEFTTSIALECRSSTNTHTTISLTIGAVTYLECRSSSNTRVTLGIGTLVGLSLRSQTDTRTNLAIEVTLVTHLDCRSSTDTRTILFLNTGIILAARSLVDIRASLSLLAQISIELWSTASTRAAIALSVLYATELELRSLSASRAAIQLNTLITLALLSQTQTRAALFLATVFRYQNIIMAMASREVIMAIPDRELTTSISSRTLTTKVRQDG